MATQTKTRPLATFSGKGAHARTTALLRVAPLAFAEDVSRSASLDNMRLVLGKSPSEAQTKAARGEWVIGRVASRLPVSELPQSKTAPAERLEFARELVTLKAAPAKPGTKARKLRAGQTGRRTVMQQRVVRAAEEAASLFFAELGAGKARTMGEKNAKQKTRAPSMAGSGKGAKTPAAKAQANVLSDAAVLLKKPSAVTGDDYVQHMQVQLASLVDFDKKHAKVRPSTHGAFAEQLLALRQTANKAANAYAERQAKAKAKADA